MKEQLYNIIKSEIYRKIENNITPRLCILLELETLVSSTNTPKPEINVLIKALFDECKIGTGTTCNYNYVSIPEVKVTY